MAKDPEKLIKSLKKENLNLQKNIEGLLARQREQEQENAKQKARFTNILREFQIKNQEMDFLTEQLEMSFGQINEANSRLKAVAYHDSLTGLPNRKLFHQKFVQEIVEAKQAGAYLGMLFLDLDGFKNINDSFGHEAGDQVLQEVALRLQSILRDCDMVARMGGDEFTILLSKISNVDEAVFVARRIFEGFKMPALIEGIRISIKTSIGISIFPLHGDSPEDLIKKADDAMYLAKRAGKNNYQLTCDCTGKRPIQFAK